MFTWIVEHCASHENWNIYCFAAWFQQQDEFETPIEEMSNVQGAKIRNSLSEVTKSLHRLASKKTLKREIIQSYWHTIIFYSSSTHGQYLIYKYINSFTIACHYSCIVNIVVFCENYYNCYFYYFFSIFPVFFFFPECL